MTYTHICIQCNNTFVSGDKVRKYCSKSCSAKYNNKNKVVTEETRLKLKNTILGKHFPHTKIEYKTCLMCNKLFTSKKSGRKLCSKLCQNKQCSIASIGTKRTAITYRGKPTKSFLTSQPGYTKPESKKKKRIEIKKNCLICDIVFTTKTGSAERKTCSKDCHYHLLSGKIGHTTHPEHICKDGKTIKLGSSWEKKIAVFLDDNNIEWIRPSSLEYTDLNGKSRKYFPDFYLTEYDIYLDPKNPMKIKNDEYKLSCFIDKIKLYYGNPKYIKDKLVGILGLEPRPPGNLPAPLRSAL